MVSTGRAAGVRDSAPVVSPGACRTTVDRLTRRREGARDLKVDRTFIDDLGTDPKDSAIVHAIPASVFIALRLEATFGGRGDRLIRNSVFWTAGRCRASR